MTVAIKPGTPGRARYKLLKPLRRECRIASAEPVCSCAFFCALFAHETAGAARTRYSLRPLIGGQGNFWQTSGLVAREIAKLCLPMTRCLKFESLPSANGSALGAAGMRTHLSTSLRGALATKQSIPSLRPDGLLRKRSQRRGLFEKLNRRTNTHVVPALRRDP